MGEKRIGRQTPTNSVVLPYTQSLGGEAIEGITAYIPHTDKEIRKIPLQEAKGQNNV